MDKILFSVMIITVGLVTGTSPLASAVVDPGPPNINKLSHINDHLGKIESKLQTLASANLGPIQDPAIRNELNGIIAHANSIASIATGMMQSCNLNACP